MQSSINASKSGGCITGDHPHTPKGKRLGRTAGPSGHTMLPLDIRIEEGEDADADDMNDDNNGVNKGIDKEDKH